MTSGCHSSSPPARRYARLRLPSSGSLGSRFPAFAAFPVFSHRYYAPLRLPFFHLGSLRLKLASRYLVVFACVRVPSRVRCSGATDDLSNAWPCSLPACLTGSLRKEITVLSSSRVTPVCTCPARRSRWCPLRSPYRSKDYSLPALRNRRLSRACTRLSSWTTTTLFSGLGHAACTLATPGFIRTLAGYARRFATDSVANLLSWELGRSTHPLGNSIQFHGFRSDPEDLGLT